MFVEITSVVIASSLVVIAASFVYVTAKIYKAVGTLQADLRRVSFELTDLLFKVNQLTTDLQTKSNALNSLFAPFETSEASPSEEAENPRAKTIPQLMGWLVSSVFLIKKTREFVKKYAKSQ